MNTSTKQLQGISRTLLMPLACRAIESARSDAIIHDPRAVEVYKALGGSPDFLLGTSGHDLFAAVMRVRQFDSYARAFLDRNPGGLVVDIGCGLDTRFDRLYDGLLTWLGLDLPEVIELRHRLLPDNERCHSLKQSLFDLSWLDVVSEIKKPVIFLAKEVIPYFSSKDFEPIFQALVAHLPGGELFFDGLAPVMGWFHNLSSRVLRETGTSVRWDVKDPRQLEESGLNLIEKWCYFEHSEPRLGTMNLVRFIPPLAKASYIVHFRLGRS